MATGVYAGTTANGVTLLASPVSINPSMEIIWDENTGRAQSGRNKAKMIGDVVAEKHAYDIQWGILTATEFNNITSKLKAGFFYFAVATSLASARSNAISCYRSEIKYGIIMAGTTTYYKDVSVTVIEQ